jgi:hypothetical protein
MKTGVIDCNMEERNMLALWSADYVDSIIDWKAMNFPGIKPFWLAGVELVYK